MLAVAAASGWKGGGGEMGGERATERESGAEMLQLWEQQLLHLKTRHRRHRWSRCHDQREDM